MGQELPYDDAINDTIMDEVLIPRHTVLGRPPLVPEIRLHLTAKVTDLWQAIEAHRHQTDLDPPYWAVAWPGSQALARYLLDHAEIVRGKTVLDLAAGGGLAGIAAARAGAASVLCAEVDGLAGTAIQRNTMLNGESNRVQVTLTDLVPATDTAPYPVGPWSVVLAGDVCYQRELAARITRFLVTQADAGACVLLADPGRGFMPKAGLTAVARYTIPTLPDLEACDRRTTVVYRVLPGGETRA